MNPEYCSPIHHNKVVYLFHLVHNLLKACVHDNLFAMVSRDKTIALVRVLSLDLALPPDVAYCCVLLATMSMSLMVYQKDITSGDLPAKSSILPAE